MLSSTKYLSDGFKIISKLPAYFSSTAVCLTNERLQSFRTSENDPLKHTKDHLGQFYTISTQDQKTLFTHGGLPKCFQIQAKTFNETCLMIRQPSVDIINCINNIDFSKPAIRFVLYGQRGNGKSLCNAHILHYAYKKGFLIFHVPWVCNWMRVPQEHSNSETREGFIDQNIEISKWLIHFKTQNAHLLPTLKTTKDHSWSKREITPKDSSLSELVEHGINRIKYASEVLLVLCNEIKNLSNNGVCKTFVSIDGMNAFFLPNTKIYAPGKIPIPPNRITATEGFLNITKFDWKNAIIVVTVDKIAKGEQELSDLPR